MEKGRHAAFVMPSRAPRDNCKKGHPYDEENTYYDPQGRKYCRICRADARARNRASGSKAGVKP